MLTTFLGAGIKYIRKARVTKKKVNVFEIKADIIYISLILRQVSYKAVVGSCIWDTSLTFEQARLGWSWLKLWFHNIFLQINFGRVDYGVSFSRYEHKTWQGLSGHVFLSEICCPRRSQPWEYQAILESVQSPYPSIHEYQSWCDSQSHCDWAFVSLTQSCLSLSVSPSLSLWVNCSLRWIGLASVPFKS